MAKTINLIRIANAKLVSADINTLGVTFAAQSPYRADGFLKVNVTVANANPTQKMFLEGADFTIYAIGGNVTKLSAYSLSMFKKLEQVWLFSSTMAEIEETDNNAYLDYLKSSCVIYVPSNLISNYQTAYSNLSSKFAPINQDYTLTIVGSGTLTSEIITDQLMNGTYNAQDREACTKLVISGFDNYMDTLWGYNLSAVLPNFNNNVWYNATEIDFTTRELEGVDELLESDITNLINGISSDKLSGVAQLKFSGFSDMSVALDYDYEDLPNLAYIWLDNVRYEKVNDLYQPVEYIESSGTQYISSGFVPNQNTSVYAKMFLFNLDAYLFGSGASYNSRAFEIFNTNGYLSSTYGNSYQVTTTNDKNYYTIAKEKNVATITTENGTFTLTSEQNTFTCPRELIIFGINRSEMLLSRLKCDYFKIKDNNKLIRDFAPCYRISDNEIGMFDKINGVFYANSGTGTFVKGNNISIDEDWWGNSIYFYPLTDLVSEYDARLTQTFYLDYNGTLPSYPDYQLTYYTDINCTTSILPENMQSGNRYYAKAIMVTLTIQGSGTLTSAIVESQVAKAGSGVTKVVVAEGFTSIGNGAFVDLESSLPSLDTLQFEFASGSSYPQDTLRDDLSDTLNLIFIAIGDNVNFSNTACARYKYYPNVKAYNFNKFYLDYGRGGKMELYNVTGQIGGYDNRFEKLFLYNDSLPSGVAYPQQTRIGLFYVKTDLLVSVMTNSDYDKVGINGKIGFLDYTDNVPTWADYQATWYSDEDCTTPIATTDFVSGNRYYVKLQSI